MIAIKITNVNSKGKTNMICYNVRIKHSLAFEKHVITMLLYSYQLLYITNIVNSCGIVIS